MSMLPELIARVVNGDTLTVAEASAAMRRLMSGEASPVDVAALLTALRMRGETSAEMTGFALVMREKSVHVHPQREPLVDTCGTGGGTIPTFNISTTAAFVVAGAGVAVAKHGNRAMTSRCGSADVLEALGVRIDLTPQQVTACIDEAGIGFLFAQAHHPAMKHVAPVRRELPFRTVFNCLGPLTNPAGAPYQVIGVYEARLVPLLAETLANLGCRRALVVHGADGLDEVSTLGVTLVGLVDDGQVTLTSYNAADFGLAPPEPEELAPGVEARDNAAMLRAILEGEKGPRRDIVLLNAAAALYAAGTASGIPEGLALATESLESGRALERLDHLRQVSGGAA